MKINSSIKVVAKLASGNVLAVFIGMIASVLQARFVDPSVLGYFNGFLLVSTYLMFAQFGTFDFMYRKLPYLIVSGSRKEAELYISTCLSWIIIILGVCSLGFIVLAGAALIRNDLPQMFGWLVQITVIAGSLYGGYLGVTYRTVHDFSRITWMGVLQSICGLVMLLAVVAAPYYGLCAKTAIVSLSGMLFLHQRRPFPLMPRFYFTIFKTALRGGFPMFLMEYVDTSLVKPLEFTIVLYYFGTHSLGLYAFSHMVLSAQQIIPAAFFQVYLPRIAQKYGEKHSIRECVALSMKPTALCFISTVLLMGVFAASFEPLIGWLMPKYIEAAPILIASAILVPIRVLRAPSLAFYAAGEIIPYSAFVLGEIVLFLSAAALAVKLGWGPAGIMLAVCAGELGRVIVSYVMLHQAMKQEAYVVLGKN
ncbi:MAG: MATE family efflux transporter [Candidatus Latescibacterota bacterium]